MQRLPLLLACAAALAGSAAAESPEARLEQLVARIMESVDDQAGHGRFGPDFDRAGLRAALAGRIAAGTDRETLSRWLNDELAAAFLAFAEVRSALPSAAPCGFPFSEDAPRRLVSGVGDGGSHTGPERFAYDFEMPVGTPVLAAREGVIARVVDGYTEGGPEDRFRYRANAVLLLHPDGAFSEYGHLRPGLPRSVGDRVAAGDLIGYSGNTGYSFGPHLHFSVRVRDSATTSRTIPIVFSDSLGNRHVPRAGRTYPPRWARRAPP